MARIFFLVSVSILGFPMFLFIVNIFYYKSLNIVITAILKLLLTTSNVYVISLRSVSVSHLLPGISPGNESPFPDLVMLNKFGLCSRYWGSSVIHDLEAWNCFSWFVAVSCLFLETVSPVYSSYCPGIHHAAEAGLELVAIMHWCSSQVWVSAPIYYRPQSWMGSG